MRFKSTVYSQVSGSIAGITYAHNQYGLYTRARSIPVQPNTQLQLAIRNAFASVSSRFRSVLTAAQVAAWDVYGANTPWTDKMGDTVNLTGQQQYVRGNTPRIQAGLTPIDDAPVEYTYPVADPSTAFAFDATDDEIDVTVVDGDAWLSEDDAAMLLYVSPPQNPGRTFYDGPYQYAGKIEGDSTTPPTGTVSVTSPFAAAADQRIHGYYLLSRADGRISTRRKFQTVAS